MKTSPSTFTPGAFIRLFIEFLTCIKLLFISRKNSQDPYILTLDEENLKNAPFIKNRPIKFLIHGYTGNRDFAPNAEVRPGKH